MALGNVTGKTAISQTMSDQNGAERFADPGFNVSVSVSGEAPSGGGTAARPADYSGHRADTPSPSQLNPFAT